MPVLDHVFTDAISAMREAFEAGGVHLVTVPIDYSENVRVLVDELRNRVPAAEEL